MTPELEIIAQDGRSLAAMTQRQEESDVPDTS